MVHKLTIQNDEIHFVELTHLAPPMTELNRVTHTGKREYSGKYYGDTFALPVLIPNQMIKAGEMQLFATDKVIEQLAQAYFKAGATSHPIKLNGKVLHGSSITQSQTSAGANWKFEGRPFPSGTWVVEFLIPKEYAKEIAQLKKDGEKYAASLNLPFITKASKNLKT